MAANTTIRIAGPVLHRAGHANHLFHARVEWADFVVCNRPIHVIAVQRRRAKVDFAEARRTASPEVRLSTNRIAAGPHPFRSRRDGERNLMVPRSFGVLVVHVAVRFAAPLGIVEPAVFHVPGHTVKAKIFFRIEAPPGIDRAHFQPASHRVLIAIPPPAPVPITIAS